MSGEFTETAAQGTEMSTEKTMTYSVPVIIPEMTTMKVTAIVNKAACILPYSSKGSFRLKNGSESYCELVGEFKVNAGSFFSVEYTSQKIKQLNEEIQPITCMVDVDGQQQQVNAFPMPDMNDFGEPVVIDPSLITIL